MTPSKVRPAILAAVACLVVIAPAGCTDDDGEAINPRAEETADPDG